MLHFYSNFIILFSDDKSEYTKELLKKFSLCFEKGINILVLVTDKKIPEKGVCFLNCGWANFEDINLKRVIRIKEDVCEYKIFDLLIGKPQSRTAKRMLKYFCYYNSNNNKISISTLFHFKGITIIDSKGDKIIIPSEKVLKFIGKLKPIYYYNKSPCDSVNTLISTQKTAKLPDGMIDGVNKLTKKLKTTNFYDAFKPKNPRIPDDLWGLRL